MNNNRGLKSSLFVYTLGISKYWKGYRMEYIKGFVKEYNELIYKLGMAVLYMAVGGMIGYGLGVAKVFTMVMN